MNAHDPDPATRDTAAGDLTTGGLALLGGVFDPVHRAHLQIARAALAHLPVDRLVFLPAGMPPHKRGLVMASPEDRLRMLELAVGPEARMGIDTRELRREGPSYTVLTLRELHDEAPGRRLFFVIGADNIPHVGKWYHAEEILRLCDLVAVPRPGFPQRFEREHLPWLDPERIDALNRWMLPLPHDASASTGIRERIARGEAVADLVPEAVAEYIETRGLYAPSPS